LKTRHYQELKQKFNVSKTAKKTSLQKTVAQDNTIRIIIESNDKGVGTTALRSIEIATKNNGAETKRKVERLHVMSLIVNEKQLD
ncbi:hypothetical protein, partial [Listeria monocytogenes]|uniref:hypothetical protein n=1 Tax=Listeria monocytogenes TaxID=1639 RepID=UPI001A913EE3